MYELSFAPGKHWSHLYPRAAQVQAYAETLTERFDLSPHLRIAQEATRATWHERSCQWDITISSGAQIEARAVIAALGPLNRPALPEIECRDRFCWGRDAHGTMGSYHLS